MQSNFRRALVVALAVTVAWPASAAAAQSGQNPPATGRGAPVDLLPLIEVRSNWRPRDGMLPNRVGGYVRFYVCDIPNCGEPQPGAFPAESTLYSQQHRGWVTRWLVGRTYSRLLNLTLSVSQPNVKVTTTLASATLSSSRSAGQNWSGELNGRRYLTPYFRLDPSTVVTMEANLNASTQVQANITQAVLDVVTRAAALIQPTGQLVTSLNEERFQQSAEFVDQSISSLFTQSLAERSTNDFGAMDWGDDHVAEIHAMLPLGRQFLREGDMRTIGQWWVYASPALISIFANAPIQTGREGAADLDEQARTAFIGLSPHAVMEFEVSENTTVRQALLGDSGIAAEVARTNGTDRSSAHRLCSLVAARAESLGFNRFDAPAIVWAFAADGQLDPSRGRPMANSEHSCEAARLAGRLRLPAIPSAS